MPLFATLIGSISGALVGLFGRIMGFQAALKLAAYTTWLAVFTAFLGSVYFCMSSLYSMISALISGGGATNGISWLRYFFMAIGMFIPANAGAVVACLGSVWIACGIYKFQRDAIQHFGS